MFMWDPVAAWRVRDAFGGLACVAPRAVAA
jgi:hypothetical protein